MKMKNPGEKILMIIQMLQVVINFHCKSQLTKKRKLNEKNALFFF